MALREITIKLDEDLVLQMKQFCQENRLSYSDAFAEILYGFFEDSTLSTEFLEAEFDHSTGFDKKKDF
jgi:hypothetical protein